MDRALAVASARDHGDRALLAQGSPDAVGVIATIGDHPFHSGRFADEQVGALHIGCVAGRQDKAERPMRVQMPRRLLLFERL